MNYHADLVEAINDRLAEALAHRVELGQALAQLEAAGMWPAVPSEQWQDRNSAGQYFYLLFRLGPDRAYQGPDGKRKVDIGRDPGKIAEARRLAENRRRWEVANRAARDLDGWLAENRRQLVALAGRCERWPALDLGPVAPAILAGQGPNGQG